MKVLKSLDEVKKHLPPDTIRSIIEEEDLVWVEVEKGLIKFFKEASWEKVKSILRSGGFPERFVQKIDDTEEDQRVQSVVSLLEAGKSAVLLGPQGTGKTHSGIYALGLLIKERRIFNPLFISLVSTDFSVAPLIKETDFLFVDDLTLFSTDAQLSFFARAVYEIYNRNIQFVLTSNMSKEELQQKLPAPVLSRLIEVSSTVIFSGEDRRVKSRKKQEML